MTLTRVNRTILGLGALALLLASQASGQCILANPSFELLGQGGAAFGGWNQFGVVGVSSQAVHGSRAAQVTGLDQGGWDVSAVWQPLDCAPGEQWHVSVQVQHASAQPLTDQSLAIVNLEWRDGGGNLINYESHTAADASTPTDSYQAYSVDSGPAPDGTASVRLLLGVLQAPGDPVPVVTFDLAEITSLSSPTLDEIQWNDFPGGRTLDFAGRTWRVKGPGYYGPGPNLFSDNPANVWVDAQQRLHLTNTQVGSNWYSTEVALVDALGYGDYVFTTQGALDQLDPAVVCGFFLWQYGPCYDSGYLWWNPYNEIDVEFSYWGNPGIGVAQFVAQPADYPGNVSRFDATFGADEVTSHAFRWLPDRVEYRSWRGGPADENTGTLIHAWTYTGPHIPRPEQPRVHLNLWRFSNPPATNQEVILTDFTFVPEGTAIGVPDPTALAAAPAHLDAAAPNPFNPRTTIRYTLRGDGPVTLVVFDVQGRRVRTLVDGAVPAGTHAVTWDGRDDVGAGMPSGLYLVQLRSGRVVETRRMTLVR